MNDKSNLKNAIFFIVIVLIILGCIVGKIRSEQSDRQQKFDIEQHMIVGVHIKGEVKKPGYYEFKYGKRIKDAIKKSGGITKDADLDEINLAERLKDGSEVIIPKKETVNSTIIDTGKKININTATVTELCKLDGIGQKLAQNIIDYRTSIGKFNKIEDIKKVDGIGKSKFNDIKENIII